MKKTIDAAVRGMQLSWQLWVKRQPIDWRLAAVCLAGALALWPLVHRLPMVGWDWYFWFEPGIIGFYPPWTAVVLSPLTALPWRSGLSLLNSITLCAVAVAVAKEAQPADRAGWSAAVLLALLSPPVFMDLWLGNIEGLVLFGQLLMPPGILLLLMKPHLTGWALLARRDWLLWGLGWGLVSLLIWGAWPLRMFAEMSRLEQNPLMIGWGNLGWPVLLLGAVLLVFSGADPLRLMSAGFLLTPYLMPNHMLLLLPALGRVRGWRRLALWAAVWLSAFGGGASLGWVRYLSLAFPLMCWFLLPGNPSFATVQLAHNVQPKAAVGETI